ncbi:MAG: hypothetical protein BRD48_02675 [Bacteroidetes bacterium QS_9_68_14]|nr:MAG: hypothetical protein BRD48_02675 [Bacteroidetes bacterium QS_9_68_14]
MSATTYTLKEVAERTGYALEDVRHAVERGDLALAQDTGSEDPRVPRTELERWQESVKHDPAGDN